MARRSSLSELRVEQNYSASTRTPASLLLFFLESLRSTWHSREMASGLHTFLTLKAHYGAAKWTEASASSLPFLPCELFCRAGLPTGNKSLSMPCFPVRDGISSSSRKTGARRSEYSQASSFKWMRTGHRTESRCFSVPFVSGTGRFTPST